MLTALRIYLTGHRSHCSDMLTDAAAEKIIEKGDSVTFVMKASGRTGWLSETEPSAVYLNGEDITDRVVSEGCLYYADMPESGETAILTIR